MVQKSDPEATPRRDKWLERPGTWAEVTIGSLLAGHKRTDVWEVVDSAHGQQVEYGHTLWFKMVNQTTGEIYPCPPKLLTGSVTFLMADDAEEPPPRTPASDAEKIALLVSELGASLIAERNHETGEITCPDYDGTFGRMTEDWKYGKEYLSHLEICHGMDVSGIRAIEDPLERTKEMATIHGRAHLDSYPHIGKGGFPHRHIPEHNLELLGGPR